MAQINRIDPKEAAFPVVWNGEMSVSPGMPIRLELATRFIAAFIARPDSNIVPAANIIRASLLLADELVEQYNKD